MCLATLQEERVEALEEFKKITAALQKATHKKVEIVEKQYRECLDLIAQLERDIKLVQRTEIA